jgi:hypothetical protein
MSRLANRGLERHFGRVRHFHAERDGSHVLERLRLRRFDPELNVVRRLGGKGFTSSVGESRTS